MTALISLPTRILGAFGVVFILYSSAVSASGAIGDHVNDMAAHIDQYADEVDWLTGKVNGIVVNYENQGVEAAKPEVIVELWEAVDFHSAIETHYIPLYANIWQGLFAVRTAIEEGKPITDVQHEQRKLEQVLWQSLGAVKVAAQYQERGLLAKVEATSVDSPIETIDVIKQRLDRVLAKHAEQLGKAAVSLVQDTYLNLFEGIEGVLIEQDAELVEKLELDFNVTLQKAIEDGKSTDDVRVVILSMQDELDHAKALLKEAGQGRSDVF